MPDVRGTVICVSRRRGLFAVQLDSGMIVVLRLVTGPMPSVDDRGRSDLCRLNIVEMRNMSSERDLTAELHTVGCRLATAMEILGSHLEEAAACSSRGSAP